MAITLIINNSSPTLTTVNNVPYTSGMNVQGALEAAYNTVTVPPGFPPFYYWLEYLGMEKNVNQGYRVQSFDGLTPFGSKSWKLYINENRISTGIDSTSVADGNTVEFKYEN